MRVVVVGAGAIGLSLAYILNRSGVDVILLEASSEAGGLLRTFDVGDGNRLEYYYHHFFTHDAEISWLLSQLEISNRVTFHRSTMGILRHGVVYPFNSVADLLRFDLPLTARLRFGLSSAMLAFREDYTNREDQPALDWFQSWAGRAATESIWRPLLTSKFGESADRIPLAWMAGRLRQRARSRKGTTEFLGYLQGSLQVLVDRLVDELRSRGVTLHLSTPVRKLIGGPNELAAVETARGELKADAFVFTTPPPMLGELVAPLNTQYAASLLSIRYTAAICGVLTLRRQLSPVYWLNIADPGFDFGGIIEHTRLVPAESYGGRHLVYISRYLPWSHPLWSMDDHTLSQRFVSELSQIFDDRVRSDVVDSRLFRARFAAPLVDSGFHKLIPSCISPVRNLFVAAMPQIYPDERSVNNSIRVAAEAATAMGLDGSMVPAGFSLSGKYGFNSDSKCEHLTYHQPGVASAC